MDQQTEPASPSGERPQFFIRKLPLSTWLILALALGALLAITLFPTDSKNMQASVKGAKTVSLGAFPVVEPTLEYGFALDTFQVIRGKVENGDVIGDLLQEFRLEYPSIQQLVSNSKEVFDVREFRIGKPYTVLTKDSTRQADYFIYEPNVYEYIVFSLKDSLWARRYEHPIQTEVQTAGGAIESSLWNAMVENGLSYEIASRMEDALQWSIDFHHLQKGDQFKLIFDQNYIEDEKVGIGQLHAAYYKNYDNEYYAIYFEDCEHPGYYDLEGRPMKKSFLKSPVKYSRISSYYNLNRYHPILKRRRPHLGTDYAAPYGTPIYAVGDGVVTIASYTKGNGNYVKIRHNDTYQTQYLHMKRFARGIRSGVHVKQGQTIGYVGATGLATGPHVCFRFWKNGRQVNHLSLSFPPPEPLPEEDLPAFFAHRDRVLEKLNAIEEPQLLSSNLPGPASGQ